MNLQTEVNIENILRDNDTKEEYRILYDHRIMMVGSCFVENIGQRMLDLMFNVNINPCGIVYNPYSVANSLDLLLRDKLYVEEDIIKYAGKWMSLSHHGSFSSSDKNEVLSKINDSLNLSRDFLKDADLLIITFGTAWVYEYIENKTIVANCHKLPNNCFRRYRLNVKDIVEIYTDMINRLRMFNSNLKIIFTVSPVRHWKDGANGNQLSKSVLLLAIDELRSMFANVGYFPSYEIMMDELRDYRFYADDMLHPSNLAVNYIWEKFSANYIDTKMFPIMKRIEKLHKLKSHRVFDSEKSSDLQNKIKTEEEAVRSLLKQ